MWSGHQMPHRLRRELAALLGWSQEQVRVVVPDTGGAFGSKSASFPEFVVVAFLAVKLQRPVRWIEDRLESMMVATRGRGQDQHARLAADADGRLLAYELNIDADVGAYPHLGVGLPMQTAWMATGPYTTPKVHATLRSILTNTMLTYPYRGAGRPEAVIALERSMDTLARRLGIDPAELRRRNFIPPESFPYETPTGRTYDSGAYARALDLALETIGYDTWRAEQARRRDDPTAKPLGIGISCYVERSGGEPGGLHEFGSIEVLEDGTVTARLGAASSGQSHESVFPALVAKYLGINEHRVRLIEGDTDEQSQGLGSFASRTAQVAGALLQHACHLVVEEARKRAAELWELPVHNVEWSDGTVQASTNGAVMSLGELVKDTGSLRGEDRFETGMAFPFGTHVAVAEADPELGTVRLLKVVTVDDCGVQIDPAIVARRPSDPPCKASARRCTRPSPTTTPARPCWETDCWTICCPRSPRFRRSRSRTPAHRARAPRSARRAPASRAASACPPRSSMPWPTHSGRPIPTCCKCRSRRTSYGGRPEPRN